MNPMYFIWMLLGFCVQAGVALRFPTLIGKGRLFSRPLWRFRPFRPIIGYTMILAGSTRLVQLFCLIVIYIPTMLATGAAIWVSGALWSSIIALYADDYYTGDDDRWHGFLNWWKRWRTKRRALRHAKGAA